MQTGDDILFTAPGPDAIPTASTEIVGQPGNALNVYWIVSHFPIGSVVSGPFPQKGSPNILDDENYIIISWLPTPGASSYDLLFTRELKLPTQPGNFGLARNLTETEFRDQGQSLFSYDLTGIPLGAPQEEHAYFNNRDFKQPTLQFIPWPIQVSAIIFEDGSEQNTAGGGAGQTPWLQTIDGNGFGLTNTSFLGIGTPAGITGTPQFRIDGKTNVAGMTFFNDFGSLSLVVLTPSGDSVFNTSGNLAINAPRLDLNSNVFVNGVPLINAAQTPWLSNIDAAGYNLYNANRIDALGQNYLTLGSNTAVTLIAGSSGVNATFADGYFYFYVGTVTMFDPNAAVFTVRATSGTTAAFDIQTPVNHWRLGENGLEIANVLSLLYYPGASSTAAITLVVTPAGDVGIGLNTPAYRLDVGGDVNATGCYRIAGTPFACSDGGGAVSLSNITSINGAPPGTGGGGMTQSPWLSDINGAGYRLYNASVVAIGTTNPSGDVSANAKLAVLGNAGQQSSSLATANSNAVASFRPNANSVYTLAISAESGNSFPVLQGVDTSGNYSTPLILEPFGGNVGIGTTTPDYSLTVSGQSVLRYDSNNAVLIMNNAQLILASVSNPDVRLWLGRDPAYQVGFIQAGVNGVGWNGLLLNPQGGPVGINKAGPGYALDVAGDSNISGVYRINGVPLSFSGGPTVQNPVTGQRALGGVYYNGTGKPLFVSVTIISDAATNGGNTGSVYAYSDGGNPPGTLVAQNTGMQGGNFFAGDVSVYFWVLAGSYYSVEPQVPSIVTLLNWTEWY